VAGSQLEQALKKRALRKAQRQMELAEQACLNEDAHNFALSEQKVHEAKRTRNFDFVKELHNQKSVKKTLEEHNKELLDLETEKNALYNTTKEAVKVIVPPPDVKTIIEKLAQRVAKKYGDQFEALVL